MDSTLVEKFIDMAPRLLAELTIDGAEVGPDAAARARSTPILLAS
jgi:hypothetical protein